MLQDTETKWSNIQLKDTEINFHLNPRTRHGHVLSELFQLVNLRLILLVNEQIAQIVKANRIFIYHLY